MEEGYEAQITKLIDHQKKQIRELKRLQNENGSKAEQIARIQVLNHSPPHISFQLPYLLAFL